jgi:glutathione S-transferase
MRPHCFLSTVKVISVLLFLTLSVDAFVVPFSSSAGGSEAHFSPEESSATRSVTKLRLSKNPLADMWNDVAKTFRDKLTPPSNLQDYAVPWETIQSSLDQKLQKYPHLANFRDNLAQGLDRGSPLHKLRLFDPHNSPEDVRITFYRDSASWCPYCQKVWMTLEEKRIPYRVEKVNMRCYGDKPAEFQRLQPSGQIPVAVLDGQVYRQSNDIIFALEEDPFSEFKSLKPPPGQEARAQQLLRLERQLFSAWMYWLTGSPRNQQGFVDILQQVEKELQKTGPYFMGDSVTLVDFQFAPFLERMAASLLYCKGFEMRIAPGKSTSYPCINKWFDAMETLESYRLTKSDYYTHAWDLPPQLGGCVEEPEGKVYRDIINGGCWKLPLESSVEPDWEWAMEEAPCEVVERLVHNRDAVTKFAARGAGQPGFPRYGAPLADPRAVSNPDVLPGLDAVLSIVSKAILDQETTPQESMLIELATCMEPAFLRGVINSLEYLRDRVGVPRDLRQPAARLLRAHLNWAMDVMLKKEQI